MVSNELLGFFQELHKVRLEGAIAKRERDKFVKCARYLWASLQAHRIQQEFTRVEFRGHPIIAPIVNLHLFKHRVPVTLYRKSEARIKSLEDTVEKLRKDHDKLVTKVGR